MFSAKSITTRLKSLGDKEKAQISQRFFKTGKGEYGEGDIFVGIRVPVLRNLAIEYKDLPFSETKSLLQSPIHEARMLALFILIGAYNKGDKTLQSAIYNLYLQNTRFVNNWDLVDSSAEHIVGSYLKNRSRKPLYKLVKSDILWDRRIAIMSTFHYIKQGEFKETLNIAEHLLADPEDLIHKAVGWMLREIGKRDGMSEENFLRSHYKTMPRTMLRYAIECLPEELRKQYLRGIL